MCVRASVLQGFRHTDAQQTLDLNPPASRTRAIRATEISMLSENLSEQHVEIGHAVITRTFKFDSVQDPWGFLSHTSPEIVSNMKPPRC